MHQRGRGIAVVLSALILAYPLSYFVLLDSKVALAGTNSWTIYRRIVSFREFGCSQEFLEDFYKPLILLDQKLRPDHWSWSEQHDLSRKRTS